MQILSALPRRLRAFVGALVLSAVTAASAWAQNAVLSGKVTNENGDALGGASVSIPALNLSSTTNATGTFTLVVPGERVKGQTVDVVVRFIGYRPSTTSLVLKAGPTTVNAQLKQDVNKIEEIVTIGVTEGTEKTKLGFSVAVVTAEDLPVPAVNPLSQLQGRVAGARIVQSSGRPGAAPSVQLRGPTSLNAQGRGQGPLYVLDGVIINGDLPDFNALDIESIEVVKGASAAALYGARAGSGVITIKTKSGSRGAQDQLKTEIRSEYGFSGLVRQIPLAQRHSLLMDETGTRFCVSVTGQATCARSIDYLAEQRRINEQGGVFALTPPPFPIDPGSGISGPVLRQRFQIEQWGAPLYNAVEQLAKPQPFSNTNVGVTAKYGKTNIFASGSFLDQGGTIRFLNGLQRSTGRLNIGQQFTDKFRMDFTSSYSRSVQDGLNQEGGGAAFFRLTRTPGIVNLLATDQFGRLFIRPNLQGGGQQNENALYSLQNTLRSDKTDRFVGGVSARYAPATWLDVSGQFGYDKSAVAFEQINDKGFRTTVSTPATNNGSIFQGQANGSALNGSVDVNARKSFSNVKVRGGLRYQYEQQDFDSRSFSGNTLAAGGISAGSNITANQSVASSRTSVRGISYIATGNVDIADRYIIDGVIRREGSSLFGPEARWQVFGRGALAWRVSEEKWWPLGKVFDQFKIRGAYGTAGGRPNFSAQYETFTINTGGILFPGLLGNTNLKPEVSKEREIGIEAQLFGSIGIEVNLVSARTTNQILPVPLAQSQGFGSQWQNAGELLNRTTEVAINVPVITKKDVDLRLRGTFDRNRTYITALGVAPYNYGSTLQATDAIFKAAVGERLGSFYGREFLTSCSQLPSAFQADCGGANSAFQLNDDGWLVWVGAGNSWRDGITRNLWQTSLAGAAAPWGVGLNWGMPIILRQDGGNAVQRQLGNALPDFNFSFSQDFRYKNLTVNALLQASIGQEVWNQGRHWSYLDFNARDGDQTGKTVETAKPLGYYYRAAPPDNGLGLGGLYDILGPNNAFVEDASFAKLREVAVGYRIGRLFGTGDWTANVIGRNLFTITGYQGFDPEVGIGGGAAASAGINAVDAFTFPNPRTVTFALQTSF